MSYEFMLLLKEKLGVNNSNLDLTKNQITSITTLELRGIEDLNGIDQLTNLKHLTITSYEYSKLTYDVDVNFNLYINTIKDYTILSKLTQLESLTISNQL